MAGSAELVRRSLTLQEINLRFLSQLLPRLLRPVDPLWPTSIASIEEEKETNVASKSTKSSLRNAELCNGHRLGLFSAGNLPKVGTLGSPQARHIHGLAATSPGFQQQSAYVAEDGYDADESIDSASQPHDGNSAPEGSRNGGGAHAEGSARPNQFVRKSSSWDRSGNGEERPSVNQAPWRREGSVPPQSGHQHQPSRFFRGDAEPAVGVENIPEADRASASRGDGTEAYIRPSDARMGKLHWIEIVEDGSFIARDCFGKEIDPRLNEYLHASKAEIEAYRIKDAHQRGMQMNIYVDRSDRRWPEQFQLAAALNPVKAQAPGADVPELEAAAENPAEVAVPQTESDAAGSVSADPDASLRTVHEMEARLSSLLASGRYEDVQKEFATYKRACQVNFGGLQDRVTAQMYTSVLLSFHHAKVRKVLLSNIGPR